MLRKLLKNKKVIFILSIFDIIFILLMMLLSSNKFFCLFIIFVLHIIIFITFLELILKIHLINMNKIINMIKILRNNNELENDELYMKKIKVNTFDGSGSLTHPSVLYFENKFGGYKYWMVYTPYDNNNVELENPCIAVSNDGINFETPDGIRNPLLEIIKKQKPNKFYNDPFLIYTDKLELWYRLTIEDDLLFNEVYRICSSDGINWSKPEKMIYNDQNYYMSLSIAKKEDIYYMFYFDMNYKLNVQTSCDLRNWNEKEEVVIDKFNKELWHGEVQYMDNKFVLFFIDKDYQLYFCESYDGLKFYNIRKLNVVYNPKEYFYKNQHFYKSSFLYNNKKLYLYIPVFIQKLNFLNLSEIFHKKWNLTVTIINDENKKIDRLLFK